GDGRVGQAAQRGRLDVRHDVVQQGKDVPADDAALVGPAAVELDRGAFLYRAIDVGQGDARGRPRQARASALAQRDLDQAGLAELAEERAQERGVGVDAA